ncbi:MAG TPA: GlsB/YeaQ/YmgE family stress response membrane protein [Actinomycetota bacterium]|nr:GlsB/YeaQ/YmgE family stress response membrane protein [Actinomycetota bacterium]
MKNLRPLIALPALVLVAAEGKIRIDLGTIVLYALIGLVVGLVARLLVPGRDPMGFFGTLVIGVIGAVIGGWLAGAVFPETKGVDWLASILVAIVLVLLVRSFSGGTWRRTY